MDSSPDHSSSPSDQSEFAGFSRNNNQLPPRKRYKSFTPHDDSPPRKRHQFATPKDVTADSASRTITAWRKLHEINLLNNILEYYTENGAYPFDDSTHMQNFYKGWIEREVYIDEDVFTTKMVELPERFFKNQDKTFIFGANLKAWMPAVDVKIYELSHMIWGNKDDDDDDDDGAGVIDPQN